MNPNNLLQFGLYLVVLLALARPLGLYMAAVFEGRPTLLTPVLKPVEALIYRLCGIRAEQEMGWQTYGVAFMVFNLLGALVVYALQRLQDLLPLNPQKHAVVTPDSSFNTAISFATNTNWLGDGGETSMSYLTQVGIVNSALWATATTAASNGSVNAMHDSFTPFCGMMPMWLMQLGEVIFGGVASGLYGMLMLAIVAVFIAGLMVGQHAFLQHRPGH